MDEELEQIEKNDTWELVPRPKDKNVIGTKWVFKNKLNENGEVIRNNARLVCKGLKKALYGLKQAPRAWYYCLDKYLHQQGFSKGSADSNLYIKIENDKLLILVVYVDEIIFGSNEEAMSQSFALVMPKEFEMSFLGELKYFIGLQIQQNEGGIFLSQTKYLKQILKKYGMEDAKPVCTPMVRRLDIMHCNGIVGMISGKSKETHSSGSEENFQNLQGTKIMAYGYPRDTDLTLHAYTDADSAGSVDDRKSTSGGAFFMGSRLVSWFNKKQSSIALSTAEA
eukprot:PITA_09236